MEPIHRLDVAPDNHLSSVLGVGVTTDEQAWCEPLARRLRTGCVFDEQPPGTFGLLVTRSDPRTRRGTTHGHRQVRAPVHAHWPRFAPSVLLLTGHEVACHARHCRGVGHEVQPAAEQVKGWPAFAAAYRAELEAWPFHTRLAVVRQIAARLRTVDTVTILSFELRTPEGSTPDYWAQRHVFCDWLRSLLPLAMPLSWPEHPGDGTRGGGVPGAHA
jgi:hypothetical protein